MEDEIIIRVPKKYLNYLKTKYNRTFTETEISDMIYRALDNYPSMMELITERG